MKLTYTLLCILMVSGCSFSPTFDPDYEPNSSTWPKPNKDARTSEQKRIDRDAVHEQQRAIMRGERPDYDVFDKY
ncbi:hypothetical protein [Providencia sneebia]|uniref:Lipoprotein n=1 Tax=Providencia sneebia DSM 19967 TaxID=1141660 RepID=K8W4R3_9GAMM|nr:hypothetical protein [Providencia sneebia]EKT55583.1 hypothetical protein OO7_11384 [Providencia sneebia DSM 19967]